MVHLLAAAIVWMDNNSMIGISRRFALVSNSLNQWCKQGILSSPSPGFKEPSNMAIGGSPYFTI
jgi:hypothetical protein